MTGLRARYELLRHGRAFHPDVANDPLHLISSLGLTTCYRLLSLQSAYAAVLGQEPALTNYTDHYQGGLDYIWMSEELIRPVGVSILPTVEEIEAGGSGRLPNARYVSDHLALDCEFVFANSF